MLALRKLKVKMPQKCLENLYKAIQRNAQEMTSTRLRAARRLQELEDQHQTLTDLFVELLPEASSQEKLDDCMSQKLQSSFFDYSEK